MRAVVPFLIGFDNAAIMRLWDADGSAYALNSATEIRVAFGGVTITRTSKSAGVDWDSTGRLSLKPAQLSEDLSGLANGLHAATVLVKDASNPAGIQFGDQASNLLFMDVRGAA